MIRVEDIGELAYGGVVTAAERWDKKRIEEGKLADKDILKKASFYGYLVPGGTALMMSAFGWMKGFEPWTERLSHGFIYDFPRFISGVVDSMGEETGTQSSAVKEAQKIMRERTATKTLTEGRRAERSYQPEFESAFLI